MKGQGWQKGYLIFPAQLIKDSGNCSHEEVQQDERANQDVE